MLLSLTDTFIRSKINSYKMIEELQDMLDLISRERRDFTLNTERRTDPQPDGSRLETRKLTIYITEHMQKISKPKVTELRCVCFGAPVAWEGTTEDGREVYIRYGYGQLLVDVDEKEVYEKHLKVYKSEVTLSAKDMMRLLSDRLEFADHLDPETEPVSSKIWPDQEQ